MDIQSEEFFQYRTSLNISPCEYRKVLGEYFELAIAEALDESQSLRMYEILQMAEVDSTLSILLNEIDEITYQELEFDSLDLDDHINDEKSKVQEMIPGDISDRLIKYHLLSREAVRIAAAHRANLLRPRVEALSDASLVQRVRFEKTFSQDVASMHSNNNLLRFYSGHRKVNVFNIKRGLLLVKYYLVEEAISLLMSIFLALLILLMFL